MGLFSFLKKSTGRAVPSLHPYKSEAVNHIYSLLFCDDLNLLAANPQGANQYPFDVVFAEPANIAALQKVTQDDKVESRLKVLAYNKLVANGQNVQQKDLQAVIVEMGLKEGLDVIACFKDGTARYINFSEKMIILETPDAGLKELTDALFLYCQEVVNSLGPWKNPRLPCPVAGTARITFLVSDGLYFGEGPINIMFKDEKAGPALNAAAAIMKYLVDKAQST